MRTPSQLALDPLPITAITMPHASEPPVDVVGEPAPDAARAFWQAFARIALELLDDGEPVGEDHAPEDTAA
jgi:hypothetical protein